jgi:hypothetical protein
MLELLRNGNPMINDILHNRFTLDVVQSTRFPLAYTQLKLYITIPPIDIDLVQESTGSLEISHEVALVS